MISPSSRLIDPLVKRAKYEAAGVPAYWIADPVPGRLTILELVHGSYETRAVLEGEVRDVRLDRPFPVTVSSWSGSETRRA